MANTPAPPPSRTAERAAMRALADPARQLLEGIGIPCQADTSDTPRRLLNALMELTSGARKDPVRHLARTYRVETGSNLEPGLIAATGVPIAGICEHHALPYTGTALVAYLPTPVAALVPAGKLARLVREYAARPTSPERVGRQVVDAITGHLSTYGAAALLRTTHTCLTLRGACATGAATSTTNVTGKLRADAALHAELLTLWSAT
ncbi:GTP cyclohydrolase I [Nonomuraea sp. NPDC003214]